MFDGFKMYENWEFYVVRQRDPETGCIPTGYEILLKDKGIEYDGFQEKVDCVRLDGIANDFTTVAEKIKKEYPNIEGQGISFEREEFEQIKGGGEKKFKKIKELFDKDIFILVSLSAIEPIRYDYTNKVNIILSGHTLNTHIMPIIGINEDYLILFDHKNKEDIIILRLVPKPILIWFHDNIPGGHDIAYLKESKSEIEE